MNDIRPIIGITMGDPVGIGPEIVCRALSDSEIFKVARPVVLGDVQVMEAARKTTRSTHLLSAINTPATGTFRHGCIDIISASGLDSNALDWGRPSAETGRAMIDYITTAVDMATEGRISAVVTGPINKAAMKLAGSPFHGHTELLAKRTGTDRFAMMMAGNRLRIVLVTIHMAVEAVPAALTVDKIESIICLTDESLRMRFGISAPRIAVAGLNPHAGEEGMFGDEEIRVIRPAIDRSKENGIDASGPYPPDTLFYHAVNGEYDAVVCMYHDQGLIPFKMIHFTDGVNTTLGLPIIRTSVDHGTAYDIAGKGIADPGSLIAAVKMAALQAACMMENQRGPA